MKNLLLASYAILLALSVSAQRNAVDDIDRENFFRIGAKAGVNLNKIPGMPYKQGFNYNCQLGGFLQFNFSKRFGFQPEVNFVQASSEQVANASDAFDDLFRGGTQGKQRFNYLELPMLLNINVGQSRHVKLQVGPSYGFLLKPNADSLKGPAPLQYKNGELSFIGGLWIQLPFINFGGRYQWGMSNIYNVVTRQRAKNQAIEVFVGFTF